MNNIEKRISFRGGMIWESSIMIHSFLLGFYKKESIDGYYLDDSGEVKPVLELGGIRSHET